ncbi:MAG: SCO family protein [Halioglobus sp.]
MSPRQSMFAGFALANLVAIAVTLAALSGKQQAPPQIQGVLLPQARDVSGFELIDHHDRTFTNAELQGRWHLVSYGFTTCPDICPTTLAQLAELSDALDARGHNDLRVLFYTVDHRRDTVAQMAAYVPYFDEDFLGLTHRDDADNPHLPFEQGLGIVAQLVPLTGPDHDPADNAYQVNHGVTLFLLNPQGKLQAIFEPQQSGPGRYHFDPQQLLDDYLAVRGFLG